jgi:hypothetical protein
MILKPVLFLSLQKDVLLRTANEINFDFYQFGYQLNLIVTKN